jgi:hypothetical protein
MRETIYRFLLVTPTSLDDKMLLQQILEFLSKMLWSTEKSLEKLNEIVQKSMIYVMLPLLVASTVAADTPQSAKSRSKFEVESQCHLQSHIVTFLKHFLRRCDLSEVRNILLKTSCLDVLIEYTYLIFSSEAVYAKGHSERIDCLELLVQLASVNDLVLLVRPEVVANFVGLVVQVLGFSQHNYIDSTDGNSFTCKSI